MQQLLVVKIGGNIIDNDVALTEFLKDFTAINGPRVLIHGGGKLATQLSTRLNIPTQMVNGRRITDADTLQVVTMTYAGWINKNITAGLNALGANAIGITGADASLLPAVKRPVTDVDFGFVGDLLTDKVNINLLHTLLHNNLLPVIAPITANSSGQLLNVNADTVAAAIATALSQSYNVSLVYCFEKSGLLADVDKDDSIIENITAATVEVLKQNGTITAGMLPKVDNALAAVAKGVKRVVIGNAAHINAIANNKTGYGTTIS